MTITASQAFSRSCRLVRPEDYQRVFRRARRFSSNYFTVLVRKNQLGFPRLGLAISRKSARTAVQRNRVKRIIREEFRLHQGRLGGSDIVFISRRPVVGKSRRELQLLINRHYKELEQCKEC